MNTLFEVYVAGAPGYASFKILLSIGLPAGRGAGPPDARQAEQWLFVASFAMAFAPSLFGVES